MDYVKFDSYKVYFIIRGRIKKEKFIRCIGKALFFLKSKSYDFIVV